MDATDKIHLTKAIAQLQVFLLSGLIAQSDNVSLSPAFIDTTKRLLSVVMVELSQISPKMRKKMPDVEWDYVDLLRDPEEIRRECLLYPSKMSQVIQKDTPKLLEILKKYSLKFNRSFLKNTQT